MQCSGRGSNPDCLIWNPVHQPLASHDSHTMTQTWAEEFATDHVNPPPPKKKQVYCELELYYFYLKLYLLLQNCLCPLLVKWLIEAGARVTHLLPFAFNCEAWPFFRVCLLFKRDSSPDNCVDWTNENVSFGAWNYACLSNKRCTFWSRSVQVSRN